MSLSTYRPILVFIFIALTTSGCRRASSQAGDPVADLAAPPTDTESASDIETEAAAKLSDPDVRTTDTGSDTETRTLPHDTEETETAAASYAFFPMAVGNTWTYEVEIFSETPMCTAGTYVSEITGTVMVDEAPAFERRSFCNFEGDGQTMSLFRMVDDRVERYYGTWFTLITAPIEEGLVWACELDECIWEKVGDKSTPAGTFNECWRRTPLSEDATAYTEVYCSGVGMVESYIDGNYTALLIDYHLEG